MMQISHVATGAAVGKFMPNPILAFLAGILIHFIIDKIPHYWPATKKEKTIFVIADYSVAAIVLALFLYYGKDSGNMVYGIAGSVIVDIVIIGVPWIFKSPLGRWHTNRQPHSAQKSIVITDMIAIAVALVLVFGII